MTQRSHQPDLSRTWILVPAFNEHRYIENVIQKLQSVSKNIIVIDDGSLDDTYDRALKKKVKVLRHRVNLGKGAALKTGCEYAFGKLKAKEVVFVDGDDQHDPTLIPQMVSKLRENNDVVFGIRDFSKIPRFRLFFNTMCSYLLLVLFGKYLPDVPSGFKALTHHGYKEVSWDATGYSVEMEIAARTIKKNLKWDTVQIPTIYHDFDRGMTLLDVLTVTYEVISWKIRS